MLGVNANTVLRALRTLRDEGLLEFRRGRGVTISGAAAGRSAVVDKARELVALARAHGYGIDELDQICDRLAERRPMALIEDPRTDDARDDVKALIPEARELQPRRGGAGARLPVRGRASRRRLLRVDQRGWSWRSARVVGVSRRSRAAAGGDRGPCGRPGRRPSVGIRIVRTTGYTCVQLGRLRGDELGLIGRDGLAGDSGRFYPMGPSTTYQSRCAANDGGGHGYMTVELGAQPASGAGGGYQGMSMCRTAAEAVGLARNRALLKRRGITLPTGGASSMPVCPAGDLRFVQYGLLGPDATSITYRASGRPQTEQTGRTARLSSSAAPARRASAVASRAGLSAAATVSPRARSAGE